VRLCFVCILTLISLLVWGGAVASAPVDDELAFQKDEHGGDRDGPASPPQSSAAQNDDDDGDDAEADLLPFAGFIAVARDRSTRGAHGTRDDRKLEGPALEPATPPPRA